MKTNLLMLLFLSALSALSMAIEIPDYKVTVQDGKFEVREYPEMTVVRTSSGDGDFMRFLTVAPDHDSTYGQK